MMGSRSLHFQPLPMPAVARCDYDVHDYADDDYETFNKTQGDRNNDSNVSSSIQISMTSPSSKDTPSFLGNNYRTSGPGGGGAGGAGGKHRCPKCGAFVTFQESQSNRIQNCFYCAACSGWFLVQPSSQEEDGASGVGGKNSGEEHSKYLLSKLGKEKEGGVAETRDVQFVMQDVSCFVACVCS